LHAIVTANKGCLDVCGILVKSCSGYIAEWIKLNVFFAGSKEKHANQEDRYK
jgi:hypothetical protein